MELHLTFQHGTMSGDGRDAIGPFLIRGRYEVNDGKCTWIKSYVRKHDVAYQGYNEGKGIWGLWEIPPNWRGGFHIWPVAMGDPTGSKLAQAVDEPKESSAEFELEGANVGEAEPVGAVLGS
jgi:hypothetical protein